MGFLDALDPVGAEKRRQAANARRANGSLPTHSTQSQFQGGNVTATISGTPSVKVTDGTDTLAISAGGAALVDGSATTQPVSGTVTANAGTGPFPVSDNGGSLTVDGAVAATQSGTWQVVPNRPSQGTGRTQVQAHVSAATSDTTIYTVTSGKTLYVTSAWIQGHNDQTVNVTRASIQKNDNTKIALEVQVGVNVVGAVAPTAGLTLSFPEPYQYASTEVVQLNIATDGVWSAGIVGYEE